jgi:2,4-dienoyl-CoA reductase (NADPH2)
MAKVVPGKEEFTRMLRYFRRRVEVTGVTCTWASGCRPPTWRGFDEVVLATGVTPARPEDPRPGPPQGAELHRRAAPPVKPVGQRVAVVGAGGIGFDVAEYLVAAMATPPRSTCPPGWPSGA